MKLKAIKIFLFLFLLTAFCNNLLANIIPVLSDTIEEKTTFFDDEIKQYAEDSLKLSIDGKKAFLYGNAKIEYQKTIITASYIEIDWNKNTIYACTTADSLGNKKGFPVFKEGNESFKAHEMTYNFKTKRCSVKKISSKEGEGYILGKTVKKVDDDIFFLNKGDYTTCDAEKPHFSIRSNRIKIIPGKKIITGPAYLTFFGIPTPLIFPFGYFPNNDKKSSGLIIPSYGESQNQGFFLKDGGYYFTLSDKLDLTLKSDVYSKGSWNFKSSLRYKNRYKYNGNLNLSFGKMINSELGFPDYSEKKDFNIKWKHKQDQKANPSLSFSANVEAGSSTYYRNNTYNANDYLKNTMSSNVNLSKSWNDGFFNNLNLSLRHSQNISTNNISLTLPDVSLNSKRIYPLKSLGNTTKSQWYDKISIKYGMSTKNTISTKDSLLFSRNSLSNFRNGMKHNIPISTSIRVLKHFNLTPSFNLTERWYLNQIEKNWSGSDSTLTTDTLHMFTRAHDYNFSTGLNTKIYGLVEFKKSKIAGIRHVISPNLSFTYRPDFSDEKYGYYKTVQKNIEGDTESYSIMRDGIYGSPSSRESGNINFSLGNILGMKIRNKKDTVETFKKIKLIESLGISSSYNLFADSLKMSNIRLNARTKLFNIFDITFSSDYDPYLTNENKNNRINQFEIATNKRLARLKSFTTSIGINVNDKSFQSDKKDKDESEKEDDKENRDFYSVPWNINANYSLNYNKGHQSSSFADTTQSLTFSGNIKITKKWKIGFRSGYDFDEKELTYSSVDIYRDLHCWEMLFHWIPIGNHKSYTLTIRVKATALRDLKYEKKKDWFTPDYD
ncbi:putative LPS assembly protein LptD [Flavobacteriales bacterium]|nr:putative LPS assembly protein LptD [Flavobacteriales bacterium]